MYSRYSGFSIPKNYGGSRFSAIKEPEVKSHRGELGGATRSAHSPSFQRATAQFEEAEETEEVSATESEAISEPIEQSGTEEEPSEECLKTSSQDTGKAPNSLGIKELFSHIDKEELIIIGLILLLMSDGTQKNDDIIAILILLLFNGKI